MGIVFQNLKTLELGYLAVITSFYSGRFTLEFLVLEELIIEECLHSMKSFCQHLILPKSFQQVIINERRYKFRGEEQLKTLLTKLRAKEARTH